MSNTKYGVSSMGQFSLQRKGRRWNNKEFHSPGFSIDVVNNNPRFCVWPNNPMEKDKTTEDGRPVASRPINARMRWTDLMKICIMIKRICEAATPAMFTASFKKPKYRNNERVKGEFEIESKFTFGISPDGKAFMKLYERGREKPVFDFEDNFWVPVTVNDQEQEAAVASRDDALSYWETIRAAIPVAMHHYFVPEVKKQKGDYKPATESKEEDLADVSFSESEDDWG